MAHEPRTVPCQDSIIGRSLVATIRLDEETGRVAVVMPQPAGTFDWHELDQFIQALTDVRAEMPGEPR